MSQAAIKDPTHIAEELNRRFAAREDQIFHGETFVDFLPRAVCADGFSVSIQASKTHYCSPRTNAGPYYSVECGYPSSLPIEWAAYAEDADTNATVFGWTPLTVVAQTMAAHGGLIP